MPATIKVPADCSVEFIRVNKHGYDRAGRYRGVGARLYRITDAARGLDFEYRAEHRAYAVDALLIARVQYELAFGKYLQRVDAPTYEEVRELSSKYAARDAINHVYERAARLGF